jgi:phage head maturation protease
MTTTTRPKTYEPQTRLLTVGERRKLGENRYKAVAAASNTSRNEFHEIDLSQLDWTAYLSNPILLLNHEDGFMPGPSAGLPIGRTLSLTRDSQGRIIMEFEFASRPFAKEVQGLWDEEMLSAMSIRWLPLETRETAQGNILSVRSILLEISIVSLPADESALAIRSLRTKVRQTQKPLNARERAFAGLADARRQIARQNPPKAPKNDPLVKAVDNLVARAERYCRDEELKVRRRNGLR